MFWEQITVDQFAAARETCGGVCVIPIGCLEKHGNQLPLGTDILTARTAAALAAGKKSEVMIFPYLPFGIVSEVKHKLARWRFLHNCNIICSKSCAKKLRGTVFIKFCL